MVCVRRRALLVVLGFFLLHAGWATLETMSSAVQAQEEAPPAAAPAAEAKHTPEKMSKLWWLIHTSGWIGAVLLVISIYFVSLTIQLFMEMRADVIVPDKLVQEWEALLAKRDYQGIYRTAKEDPSELGQLVAAGMQALSSGLPDARESMERLFETITVHMEKRISMLAVIGSLGPLIGLLGTLSGMISSFSVIAMSETQLKASEVAGGISEALLITFEGVALSVPAIYFFAVFKNRVSTLSLQALNTADEFVRRIYATSHAKAAPQAPAQPQPTA